MPKKMQWMMVAGIGRSLMVPARARLVGATLSVADTVRGTYPLPLLLLTLSPLQAAHRYGAHSPIFVLPIQAHLPFRFLIHHAGLRETSLLIPITPTQASTRMKVSGRAPSCGKVWKEPAPCFSRPHPEFAFVL